MTQPDREVIEVTLPAPIADAWRAVRDPDHIRRWFGWQHDGLDDEIRFIFADHVEADDATTTLHFGSGDRFTLTADGRHTRLRVTRPAPADDASEVYDDVAEGWITFVQQLRLLLARHPGQDRRTLFLQGYAADVDAYPLEAALGLTGPAALSPGSPYDTRSNTGEPLRGEVWYRTQHQVGLTVEQYGDGLLVLNDMPEGSPHGGGKVVITTYGLDDAAFADLERRWTTWWRDRYRAEPDGQDAGQ